jgi:hypothetical protein
MLVVVARRRVGFFFGHWPVRMTRLAAWVCLADRLHLVTLHYGYSFSRTFNEACKDVSLVERVVMPAHLERGRLTFGIYHECDMRYSCDWTFGA